MGPYFGFLVSLMLFLPGFPPAPQTGNSVIKGKSGPSEIVITTTHRLAGAIHSLTWNGKEFIDSTDHGRQLQSACAYDCSDEAHFWPEAYNPTEAGNRSDGEGPKSTSQLLRIRADKNELETETRMAYWLLPNEKSAQYPALNKEPLSNTILRKKVKIGYQSMANVIDYQVTFQVPKDQKHTYAQFEALTGYMPAEFSQFHRYNREKKILEPLDDGPGEQDKPVVLSTGDGSHAMGIWSPDLPSPGWEKVGYGRFRFKEEKVVKWNCVFRTRNPQGIRTGDYHFKMFVVVGTREDVQKTLAILTR